MKQMIFFTVNLKFTSILIDILNMVYNKDYSNTYCKSEKYSRLQNFKKSALVFQPFNWKVISTILAMWILILDKYPSNGTYFVTYHIYLIARWKP